MEKKKCTRCKKCLSQDSFAVRSNRPSGRDSYCKTCRAEMGRIYRQQKGDVYRQTERNRYRDKNRSQYILKRWHDPQTRPQMQSAQRRYRQSAKYKRSRAEWDRKNRDKSRACDAVRRALKNNILHRPERCSHCKKRARISAHHHHGYGLAQRLDVIWLCPRCHNYFNRGAAVPMES